MSWKTFENGQCIERKVYFLSAFYRPGDGIKALVIGEDNMVHEIDPNDLSLPVSEYNKIFAC